MGGRWWSCRRKVNAVLTEIPAVLIKLGALWQDANPSRFDTAVLNAKSQGGTSVGRGALSYSAFVHWVNRVGPRIVGTGDPGVEIVLDGDTHTGYYGLRSQAWDRRL